MELAFRARIPGNAPLQLHELDPTPPTRTTEPPFGTPPDAHPGLPVPHGPTPRYQPRRLGYTRQAKCSNANSKQTHHTEPRRLLGPAAPLRTRPRHWPADSDSHTSKPPPTNRATLVPAPPTQMTANWSTIAPSTYSPCPTGPSMDVSLPTRIQPLPNITGLSQQDKRPGSNRTSQALAGTCRSPLAKTYATAA